MILPGKCWINVLHRGNDWDESGVQEETLAIQTLEDEGYAHEQWRPARDTAAYRHKVCIAHCCDALYQ